MRRSTPFRKTASDVRTDGVEQGVTVASAKAKNRYLRSILSNSIPTLASNFDDLPRTECRGTSGFALWVKDRLGRAGPSDPFIYTPAGAPVDPQDNA